MKRSRASAAAPPEVQTTLDLKIDKLTIVKKADLGRDEPMLWTIFIVLSLDTVNSQQFVVLTDPLKGKLARAGKGDTVSVPASIGHFHNENGRIAMIGVLTAAFDNDLRTKKQIQDGYAAAAATLNQAILDHFPKFGFAPVGKEEEEEIQDKIIEAIKQAFLDRSWFLTLFGGKGVGGATFTRTLIEDEIDEKFSLTMKPEKNDRAIYRADGSIKFSRVSP